MVLMKMLMSSINHTLVKVSVEVLDTPLLRTSSQVNFSQPSSSTQPSHALVSSNTYLENPYPMAKHVGVDEQGMYLDDGDEVAACCHAEKTRLQGVVSEESKYES